MHHLFIPGAFWWVASQLQQCITMSNKCRLQYAKPTVMKETLQCLDWHLLASNQITVMTWFPNQYSSNSLPHFVMPSAICGSSSLASAFNNKTVTGRWACLPANSRKKEIWRYRRWQQSDDQLKGGISFMALQYFCDKDKTWNIRWLQWNRIMNWEAVKCSASLYKWVWSVWWV